MRSGVVLLLMLQAAGCARPWQTARTVVLTSADAVAAADEAVLHAYEASSCETTDDVAELEACVERLEAAVEGLRVARSVLEEGEALVDVWQRSREQPGEWRRWAGSIGQVIARLVPLLEAAGVAVPEDVSGYAALLETLLERVGL